MSFPARKVAIGIWIAAGAYFIDRQIQQPILTRDMLHSTALQLIALDHLASAILYPGGVAALGAIVHLLGEIRDAAARRMEQKP